MRRTLWGWDVAQRRLLAVMALVLASALWHVVSRPDASPAIEPGLVVNPNTAPSPVLLALPRLGPVLVGRIVAERESRPFASLSDLDRRVRGIGPATIAAIGPYLRIEPETRASGSTLTARLDRESH